MSTQAYKTIQSLIPKLSNQEKAQVKGLLSFSQTHSSISDPDHGPVVGQDLLQAMAESLSKEYGVKYPPSLVLLERQNKNVALLAREAEAFLNQHLDACLANGRATKAQRLRFYKLFARLTAEHLRENKIPANLKTILQSHQRFPSLIDRAFPGYSNSGLLDWVLMSHRAHRHRTE